MSASHLNPEQGSCDPLSPRQSAPTGENGAQLGRGAQNGSQGPPGGSGGSKAPADGPIDALYAAVAERIQTARRARGFNQQALGDAVGLGRTSICNVEAGRQRPPLHTLIAIAQALRIDPEDLLLGPLPELTTPIPTPTDVPRRFYLQRNRDVSGVSGTGVVAHGVMWADGTASVRWSGQRPSIVFWDGGMDDAEAVHGHGGATRLIFLDDDLTEGGSDA